ncbi:concanavalin A-like lectin/glucanase superfamily protein [Mariniflexile fucanivorans]|uniref:Concanavalin A-like lectin/glucanase superfamily protein n=1 Tax=Mariniflexile fucanivorans TaxID=264023 RepID=A0A4R1RNU5_9FLAO|nr:LamG domain-containing protein [Mariniflexile fucanivorans]TCL67916.1 concanavalin A-like lectin/glucanase superfamily protein [Mariniflexile fucanivorans]
MKTLNKYFIGIFALFFALSSCNEGIDPITAVDPGPDAGAPVVNIIKPLNGFEIQVPEPITSVSIQINAQDDIELSLITIKLDGAEIASYSDFLDYRIVNQEMVYDNVTTGDHILTVEATDIVGNITISTVNFSKVPPYTPLFNGETFYMNFDGSYTNLLTLTDATEVGSPGFSSIPKVGSGAYKGAANSYLTYPAAGLAQGKEFSATFWLKIDASDTRAGIINMAPALPAGPSDKPSGFGLIREGSATSQKFVLLVGNGTNATWVNPGAPATIDPTLEEWVHFGISISESKASLYMNGELAGESTFTGMNWEGVGNLAIMSGEPNFSGWNHKTEKGLMDELRLFNVALTKQDIVKQIALSSQKFYMPFEGSFTDKVSKEDATEVGSPGFSTSAKVGNGAYKGAADSYLTFPSTDLAKGNEFSTTFWLKIDGSDTRASIINMAPALPAGPSDKPSGFGLIREGSATAQKFILLVGNGTNATWVNPGAPATIDPTLNEWVHFGISISESKATLYMNGALVGESVFTGLNWTGVGDLAIMSGDPNFNGWNHKTEKGLMDELRIFNKALSLEEVQAIYN